jgi:multicomponent Na+:H+ antiporter subunit C
MSVLPYLVAGWLLLVGLYGAATSGHLVHMVVCLTVAQSSTVILLLAIGYRQGAAAPFYSPPDELPVGRPVVDPVVQALTLTDIVVEAVVVAMLLALAVQAHRRFGTVDPQRLTAMHD